MANFYLILEFQTIKIPVNMNVIFSSLKLKETNLNRPPIFQKS